MKRMFVSWVATGPVTMDHRCLGGPARQRASTNTRASIPVTPPATIQPLADMANMGGLSVLVAVESVHEVRNEDVGALLSATRGLEELPLRDVSLVEHRVLVHLNDRRVAVGVLEWSDGD
jgi:hypothetical protein